jgi:nitrate/nitrite-specific signal transduction histidine kinase
MVLGSLVLLLLVSAIAAIMLLHGLLGDLQRVSHDAVAGAIDTNMLSSTLTVVESELTRMRIDPGAGTDRFRGAVQALTAQTERPDSGLALPEEATTQLERVRDALSTLAAHSDELSGWEEPAARGERIDVVREDVTELRHQVAAFSRLTQARTTDSLEAVTRKFRLTGLGLAIVFLVLINGSIMVLLRAAAMILRPVDSLIDAGRRLAREEFDHRLEIDRRDEFGELAGAYNQLASQLAANEQRKLETLHHVARTLNHELNNAMSIIEMQLSALARMSGPKEGLQHRLREIHRALERMTGTVDALKRVRRIVLTDYVSGIKMLDLPRSTAVDPPVPQVASEPPVKAG